MSQFETVSAEAARVLLLSTHGLLDDPAGPATPKALLQLIRRLGFVQLDTISVVERAHHHILHTRQDRYRPALLDTLHRKGALFEHITHDASLIPAEWFPHWKYRFARAPSSTWFLSRLGGDPQRVIREVRSRIRREGPLMARDFEDPRDERGTWWEWKPAKAALEYLWRRGELTVARRDGFQKVYDLTERVLPEISSERRPSRKEHVAWTCRSALDRLVIATPKEIAAFWRLVTISEVREWLSNAQKRGEIIPVMRRSVSGTSTRAFAQPEWKILLDRAPTAPALTRLLSPFDPVIRDRLRLQALFDFEYQFEAFVPRSKRRYGYYVLPILKGDRLIGRLDSKLDRASGVLRVLGVWWEPSFPSQRARSRALNEALERYCTTCGATRWEVDRGVSGIER